MKKKKLRTMPSVTIRRSVVYYSLEMHKEACAVLKKIKT